MKKTPSYIIFTSIIAVILFLSNVYVSQQVVGRGTISQNDNLIEIVPNITIKPIEKDIAEKKKTRAQFTKLDEGARNISESSLSTPSLMIKRDMIIKNETRPKLKKLIQPGSHMYIPKPETIEGPNGEKGYVHDPKFLVKNPPPFQIPKDQMEDVCYAPPGEGEELKEGYESLKKIRQHIETSSASRDVKLFCAIYTYSPNSHLTDTISQTWGPRCDGMLYSSNVTDPMTGHVNMPSLGGWGFQYLGIFQRVRVMMTYLYDNFLNEYDFFHFCGDDTYMMVENMKEFLASDKVREWDEVPDQYLIAGFWINWGGGQWVPPGEFYLGGGSGYTLSRKALKAYVEGPLAHGDEFYQYLKHMGAELFPYVTQGAYMTFHNHDSTYLRRVEVHLYRNIENGCHGIIWSLAI